MDIDIKELEMILLPGKCPPKNYLEYYQKAYDCWRDVWSETYRKEMNINEFFKSDDFTRQDEVFAFYYKGECVGLTFLKWVDFAENPVKHDSYFETWPETALKKLCKSGNTVIVCSQFTLAPKFRKSGQGTSWKDLMAALIVERFRYSDADAMTGTMRLKKNMGALTYKSGATPLVQGLDYNKGEETVDLVAFYQDTAKDFDNAEVVELLKIVFPKIIALVKPIIKLNKEVKRAA